MINNVGHFPAETSPGGLRDRRGRGTLLRQALGNTPAVLTPPCCWRNFGGKECSSSPHINTSDTSTRRGTRVQRGTRLGGLAHQPLAEDSGGPLCLLGSALMSLLGRVYRARSLTADFCWYSAVCRPPSLLRGAVWCPPRSLPEGGRVSDELCPGMSHRAEGRGFNAHKSIVCTKCPASNQENAQNKVMRWAAGKKPL